MRHARRRRDVDDLTLASPIAIRHRKIPPAGPAQQMAFEMGAWVARAMPRSLCGAVTTKCGTWRSTMRRSSSKAANAYREVAAGAKPGGAPPGSMSPPNGNTTLAAVEPSGGTSTGTGEGSIDVRRHTRRYRAPRPNCPADSALRRATSRSERPSPTASPIHDAVNHGTICTASIMALAFANDARAAACEAMAFVSQ